jgi:hypothetical protein
MRIANFLIFFTRRSCIECKHFKPILLRSTKEFGKCSLYKDNEGTVGYADAARIDQGKCGDAATWLEPKTPKKTVVVMQ